MFSLFNFSSIFPQGSADPICTYVRTPMFTASAPRARRTLVTPLASVAICTQSQYIVVIIIAIVHVCALAYSMAGSATPHFWVHAPKHREQAEQIDDNHSCPLVQFLQPNPTQPIAKWKLWTHKPTQPTTQSNTTQPTTNLRAQRIQLRRIISQKHDDCQ